MIRKILTLYFLLITYALHAQKPVLTVPSGQNSWIMAHAITPNGKYLVSAAMDRSIKIYDLNAKKEVFTFWGQRGYACAIAIANDNRTIISGDNTGNVVFWDLNTGRILKSDTTTHSSNISSIAISPDQKNVITANWGGNVAKWDLAKRDTVYRYRYNDYPITKVAFSPDGKYFFSGSPDTSKKDSLWNLSIVDQQTSDPVNGLYLTSALYRSAVFAQEIGSVFYLTAQPAEIRKYNFLKKQLAFKFPLGDVTPIDALVLDNGQVLILCADKDRNAIFFLFDENNQRITKTINTSIKVVTWHREPLLLQKYPNHPDKISVSVNRGFNIFALDLKTEKVDTLQFKKSSYQGNPVLINDQLYLGGEDDVLKRINFKNGEVTKLFADSSHIYKIVRLKDHLIMSSWKKWMVWDLKNDKMLSVRNEAKASGTIHFSISPNKETIAIDLGNGQFNLYKTSDYSLIKFAKVAKYNVYISDIGWLDDQSFGFYDYTGSQNKIYAYHVNADTVSELYKGEKSIRGFLQLNDSTLFVGLYGGAVQLINLKNKQVKVSKQLFETENFQWISYEEILKQLIVSGDKGEIFFLDPKTLTTTKQFFGHISWLSGVTFNDDYTKMYSTAYDNTIKIWDVATAKEITTFSILNNNEWVVNGKNNLFDASANAMKWMYYVVNDPTDAEEPWKIIELDQLKHRYYQPNLMPIQLGYSQEALRKVVEFDKVELAPKVKLDLNQSTLNISLNNQKGGIGKVSVFLNNVEVISDARINKEKDKNLPSLQVKIELSKFENRFAPGDVNYIKVIAWNGENWLHSAPQTVAYTPKTMKGVAVTNNAAQQQNVKPRLFALVIGTSDYSGTQIDLKYAGKDAADFAAALKNSAERLFGATEVEVNLINSEATDKNRQPEKKNIINMLDGFSKKMKPTDILIVYLSGHGVNFGGADGDFYYLTKDAAGADASYLADPYVRTNNAISSAELTTLLNKITAKKKMLILDACASGKAAETMLAAARDVPASQVRALDRMKDRTGFYILSGSASDAVSYESSIYGQGLLTYSLLKAMKGEALRIDGGEEYVDIQKLLQYAVDEVPKLAAGIGGIQKPLYRSPDNQQSFDIGKADERFKASILLAEPKPVFVTVGLQDPNELFDRLGLSEKINAALRENTAKGKHADFIFSEAKDYPGAYRISGTYEENGDELTLKYVLIKDKMRIGEVKSFKGSAKDINTFIANFIAELKKIVK